MLLYLSNVIYGAHAFSRYFSFVCAYNTFENAEWCGKVSESNCFYFISVKENSHVLSTLISNYVCILSELQLNIE